MSFLHYLKDNIVFLDGGMGTLLQNKGLSVGEYPETWNVTHPETVVGIHRDYYDAGANVVCANTFGANCLKFGEDELYEIIKCAIYNVKKARETSASTAEKFVAFDMGPTGKLLKPLGDLDFEDAVEVFAKSVRIAMEFSPDLFVIETMNDAYETKAALLAVKENSDLPVIVTNVYGEDGKLMTGATPEAMATLLEGMGADAIGANCSLGPKELSRVAERLLKVSSVPVVLKPNAGLPRVVEGKTVFGIKPLDFARELTEAIKKGVRVAGGCCGTTPEYIKALTEGAKDIAPVPITDKNLMVVSSYTHAVSFGKKPILIGERINPTGKKRFKEALLENDMTYILNEAVNQADKGVHILDVNVGLPEIDEVKMLETAVCEIQAVTDLPLQIDTSNEKAMDKALRRYNGKAMINSVSGKKESMEKVFPLVKKYGGVVVALTLDERGIPDTAEQRFEIAQNILDTAKTYGIKSKDIVFDTLAMTVSADSKSPSVTLSTLKMIKERLGAHTSLGVSNVSFGLPNRDLVNSTFFAMALENGLSAAIMNPYSAEMMKTYYSYSVLRGFDENCTEYIAHADEFSLTVKRETSEKCKESSENELHSAIVKGLRERAGEIVRELVKTMPPLDIVNAQIIPALNEVGRGFEEKRVYLPSLLMSAEAAKSAFEVIKEILPSGKGDGSKGTVVIATVEGDIHDIGKNIVKLILENYSFDVVDLGKDVKVDTIVEKTVELHAPFVGLSALMTTTVPAMEKTIKELRKFAPWCKIVVGGAVLTKDYANKIGADFYASDALECVRLLTNG